ncbi:TRAPP trafficking subunit Trs65-domain-containing protein [Dipodascopsis tothii]|uniref:TRAPP trafficking subunit Trs65-domain-containing protein n=1 Tax=Dipodascopsis tothii TaxID=44089 RepID=UPI0034CDBE3D
MAYVRPCPRRMVCGGAPLLDRTPSPTPAGASPMDHRSSIELFSTGTVAVHVPDLTGDRPSADRDVFALTGRRAIFYDEKITIYVRLQLDAPHLSRAAFDVYLSRLVFAVEGAAVSGVGARQSSLKRTPGSPAAAPVPRDVAHPVFSLVLDSQALASVEPVAIADESAGRSKQVWHAYWRADVVIDHPKARLVNPRIAISAGGSLRARRDDDATLALLLADEDAPVADSARNVDYLRPLEPMTSLNLFGGLAHDVVFQNHMPTLADAKISAVRAGTPVSSSASGYIRLARLSSRLAIPVFPSVGIRLRCARMPTSSKRDDELVVLVSLDVDVAAYAGLDVELRAVDLSVVGGRTTRVNGPQLPLVCRPRDSLSEVFRIYPLATTDGPPGGGHHRTSSVPGKNLSRLVHIKVVGVPVLRRTVAGNVVGPEVITHWNTLVDFLDPQQQDSIAVRAPGPASPAPGGSPRPDNYAPAGPKPRAISGPGSSAWQHMQQQQRAVAGAPAAPPPLAAASSAGSLREIVHEGLSLTFYGPTEVRVGEIFEWKVFITNRSRTPKRVALLIQPKNWKSNNVKALPRYPTAGALLDDAALYAIHQAGSIEASEIVSLVNDLRIGPLAPGASYETEIRFVALGVGVLTLEGIRVVDLIKGEGFDCTDLMHIISRR